MTPIQALTLPEMVREKVALIVIDLQQCGFSDPSVAGIPLMSGYGGVVERVSQLVDKAHERDIPVIFTTEVHRFDLADIGRELDGAEGPHCLEDDPGTSQVDTIAVWPGDFHLRKRRYSVFFGTDLEILLKGIGASTLILVGALTDVCVHYSFVDAHQRDYHLVVVSDCVIGSSESAHRASLSAMSYLQRESVHPLVEVLGELDALPMDAATSTEFFGNA